MFKSLPTLIAIGLLAQPLFAQTTNNLAPGAPGRDAQWEGAGKVGVGTSATLESKVWFTLRGGVMTEVYYPTVDVANVRALQFIVVSPDRKTVEVEAEDTTHGLLVLDPRSLTFSQVNQAKSGAYTIRKTYAVDPRRNAIQIRVHFETRGKAPHSLYVYYDPSLNNSGMHDSAWTQGDALLASDADKASAVISSTGLDELTNGYFETSDGLMKLRQESIFAKGYSTGFDDKRLFREGRVTKRYARAADGNVVQVARVKNPSAFTLALGFGKEADEALKNARATLGRSFAEVRTEFDNGWHEYLDSLRKVEAKYQAQFDMAAMVLKAHEDKTYRGANVASLSVPWGGGENANEPNVSGYHTVWARDLYQVAAACKWIRSPTRSSWPINSGARITKRGSGTSNGRQIFWSARGRLVDGTVHTPGRQHTGRAQPRHARHRRGSLLEAAVNYFQQ